MEEDKHDSTTHTSGSKYEDIITVLDNDDISDKAGMADLQTQVKELARSHQ